MGVRLGETSSPWSARLLPDAETRLANVELVRRIAGIIQSRGLTQREAAGRLGIDQLNVSAIAQGRLGDLSLGRLLTLVNHLGMDMDITVSPNPEPSPSSRMVVRGTEAATPLLYTLPVHLRSSCAGRATRFPVPNESG